MHLLLKISHAVRAAALAALPVAAAAQRTSVAYVKTVTGDAWVTTTGQRVKAVPGTEVSIGSQIKTAAGAF